MSIISLRRLCFYTFLSFCPQGWGGMRGCSGGGGVRHAWLLLGGGRACVVAWGGMHGCLGGVHGCLGGGVCGCSGGPCMVAPGGHTWLLWGVCMVAPWGCVCGCLGVHGCSEGHAWLLGGVCMVALGGACVVALRGHAWDTTRYGDTVNERAVRILLECILVIFLTTPPPKT